MIRRDIIREFKREYFHALRNGKSESDAYMAAMDVVKARVHKELECVNEIDRREQWADIAESLTDFWIVLRDIPVDTSKIPPKAQMVEAELEKVLDKGKG